MSIIEYTRPARCKDCKYFEVKRFKSFPPYRGWCNLNNNPTKQKNEVCGKWKYKYEND